MIDRLGLKVHEVQERSAHHDLDAPPESQSGSVSQIAPVSAAS